MLSNKSRNVFVALIGHPTLSPGTLYFLAMACLPIPPVYLVNGIASLNANTSFKYAVALAIVFPLIASPISRVCLKCILKCVPFALAAIIYMHINKIYM
jgi:hypothetical protein